MSQNDERHHAAATAGNSIVEIGTSASSPLQKDMRSDITTDMAAMNVSPDGDKTRLMPPSSASKEEEHSELQIKDVTDYSVDSNLEISASLSSEGLLRGWSQEENGGDDGVVKGDVGGNVDNDNSMNREKALKALRKGAVAVTGTALVVAGIPLIPMPTPGGVIVSGSGLALLATEFPAAQRVLDKGRDGLEKMVGEEGDDDDDSDEEDNAKSTPRKKKGYSKIVPQSQDNDEGSDLGEECEEASLMSTRSANTRERVDEIIKNTRKAAKHTKRNVKSFVRGTVLPMMARITTDKGDGSDSESTASASPGKRLGILRRKSKDSPKNSPSEVGGTEGVEVVLGKEDHHKPLRTKNDTDVHNCIDPTSFPVTLPELIPTPIKNDGTVVDEI